MSHIARSTTGESSLLNLTTLSSDEPDSSSTFFRFPKDSRVAALISPIPTCPLAKTSPGTTTAGPSVMPGLIQARRTGSLLCGLRGNSELKMICFDIFAYVLMLDLVM